MPTVRTETASLRPPSARAEIPVDFEAATSAGTGKAPAGRPSRLWAERLESRLRPELQLVP